MTYPTSKPNKSCPTDNFIKPFVTNVTTVTCSLSANAPVTIMDACLFAFDDKYSAYNCVPTTLICTAVVFGATKFRHPTKQEEI